MAWKNVASFFHQNKNDNSTSSPERVLASASGGGTAETLGRIFLDRF
jgi:hypothetical protein